MSTPFILATVITAALTVNIPAGGRDAEAPLAHQDAARAVTAFTVNGPRAESDPTTTRRINVAMEDHNFSPNVFDTRVGDRVTFTFSNFGKVVHDAFIGDKAAHDRHEAEMREAGRRGTDSHNHAHEGVTVAPGESGTLDYFFDKAGTLEIACHQPGHYEAGMIAVVNVNPA